MYRMTTPVTFYIQVKSICTNRPAQQRRPSHQHSNSIDKKRERSTQTRCTYTGFPAFIHTNLTDIALELTCRSQVIVSPSIPACLRSWTSSTGKSIVELSWFLHQEKKRPTYGPVVTIQFCSSTDSRHQPLYRWNNVNKSAQQRRPSHQPSNSIDKTRENLNNPKGASFKDIPLITTARDAVRTTSIFRLRSLTNNLNFLNQSKHV
jgi:hypothetical protein